MFLLLLLRETLRVSFIAAYQTCITQKARRAKLININFPRAAKKLFRCTVIWKKILVWQLIIPEAGLLQHFLQLRKLSQATRKALAGRMLCRPAVYSYFRELCAFVHCDFAIDKMPLDISNGTFTRRDRVS